MQTEIQENFIQTVMIHKKIIYKVCHVYCKQHDDKKDLAQEIIYQLWRSFA